MSPSLRTQFADAATAEARQYLLAALDDEVAACRELADKLFQLYTQVFEM